MNWSLADLYSGRNSFSNEEEKKAASNALRFPEIIPLVREFTSGTNRKVQSGIQRINLQNNKRWRDGESKRLEDDIADALIWLKPAAVLAREKHLEIEERERKRAEEAARRERLRERKRKAGQVKEYQVSRDECTTRMP